MISGQILDGKNILEAVNLLQKGDVTTPSIQSLWGTNSDDIVINNEYELPIIRVKVDGGLMNITNNCDFDILASAITLVASGNSAHFYQNTAVVSVSDTTSFRISSLSVGSGISIVLITRLSTAI